MHRVLCSATIGLLLGLPLIAYAVDEPPAGAPGGDYVGSDICSECHEDKFEQILPSRHAQMNDMRTPFAKHGCETCHGLGETHAASEGEEFAGLIVYGKDSGCPGRRSECALSGLPPGYRSHALAGQFPRVGRPGLHQLPSDPPTRRSTAQGQGK